MSTVAHASCEAIGLSFNPKTPEDAAVATEMTKVVDEYLFSFAVPTGRCVRCQRHLGGLLGSLRWGLVHGEMVCECGYPARAYHNPKDADDKPVFSRSMELVLQYHPSIVDIPKKEDEAA